MNRNDKVCNIMKKCNITYFVFIGLVLSCSSLPASPENHSLNDGDDLPFAVIRPRQTNLEEFTAVFSSGDVELDFRKSFISSEAQIFTALYEGLFSYHPFTMEPLPGVATRWTVSEDRKQWTFILRRDAKYWNGDPVIAEHFRSAWLSLLNPNADSPYASLFDIIEGALDYRTGRQRDPNRVGIVAPDDYTLIVRLTNPASFFRSMLCHHSFSPIHPSMLNKQDWSLEIPISNGPFYIQSHNSEEMILLKNESYWDARGVALKRIILKFVDDSDRAASMWNTGEARWIAGGNVNLSGLTDRSGIRVDPMFATHYYFIRSAEKPWNDHRVRRALSLSLPWEDLRAGTFIPATTLIYPLWGYPRIEGVSITDTVEARKLLAEAGFDNGVGLPPVIIRITPSSESFRVGSLMARAWNEKLGVQAKIEIVPYNQYFQSLKGNDYNVGYTTWIGDFADPYTFLQMWRRDSNLNDAQHNDADYERLMERSMTEEGERRMVTLAEAEKLLLDRGTVLPIFHTLAINIVNTDEIDGWYPNALDIHPFKYLSYKVITPLPNVALIPHTSKF